MDVPKPAREDPVFDNLTKRFFEDAQDGGRAARRLSLNDYFIDTSYARPVVMQCFNTGTDAVTEFEPMVRQGVYPGSSLVAAGTWNAETISLDAIKPVDDTGLNDLVVALEPIAYQEAGQVAVTGLLTCPVYFSADNEKWLRTADILPGITTLAARPEGAVQILYADPVELAKAAPVTVDCLVLLGPPRQHKYTGLTVDEFDPPPGGAVSGLVSIYHNDVDTGLRVTATMDHMHNDQKISASKEVLFYWSWQEKLWRIIGAECEENPPAVGQIVDDRIPNNQSVTTTPQPINAFVPGEPQEIATPNVTVDAANAQMTLPDVPTGGHIYRANYTFQITPGSNNTTYNVWQYLNGVQQTPPLATIDGRQSGTTITASGAGLIRLDPQSAPTVQVRISTDSGSDTATWNNAIFSLERNLDA